MQKIKWHYDKKFKQWYCLDTSVYACDGFTIKKDGSTYKLVEGHLKTIGHFRFLSSAKTVANLLRHG